MNNTFLEIDLVINVKMNVIIPYLAKQTYLTKVIKIGDLFVQGRVPQYYNQSGTIVCRLLFLENKAYKETDIIKIRLTQKNSIGQPLLVIIFI
ncbi:hypothetical protein J7E67_26040 [Bacillus sp. ISL-46]|nr:hypothetical protein [Bacillus sp. ISL-46]